MPKIIFKFDIEKDLWNAWDTCNYISPWEGKKDTKNAKLNEICSEKKFEDCKEQIRAFYKELHKSILIQFSIDSFQKAWDSINDEFFERLEKIMKKPFPFKKVTAYLTTQGRCPYNDKEGWFMVNLFGSEFHAMETAGHELIHLHFHNTYWQEVEKQIGREKTADLKEALTVLLNLEFRDLWFVKDEGKNSESQKKLRESISDEWKKEKDFEILLKKCINYLEEK